MTTSKTSKLTQIARLEERMRDIAARLEELKQPEPADIERENATLKAELARRDQLERERDESIWGSTMYRVRMDAARWGVDVPWLS